MVWVLFHYMSMSQNHSEAINVSSDSAARVPVRTFSAVPVGPAVDVAGGEGPARGCTSLKSSGGGIVGGG
jgi:hypothetical protein